MKDSELSLNPQYLSLKSQIFEVGNLKKLSPSQMVAACVSLGRLKGNQIKEWTAVANALKANSERDSSGLNASQIAVCLYWIAKSGYSVCVRDRIIEAAFKRLLAMSNDWSPFDIGWLLHFMRKKGENVQLPIWERMLLQLIYRFNERISQMSTKNIVCILSELSHMQIVPGKAILRALSKCDASMSSLDFKTIRTLVLSLGSLKLYEPRVINSLASCIPRHTEATIQQAAQILYGFALLDFFSRGILDWALDIMRKADSTGKLNPIDVAQIAYSLGRFGVGSCKNEWDILIRYVLSNIDRLSPLNFAVFVNALGKIGYRESTHIGLLYSHFEDNITEFTDQQFVNIAASLSNCGRTYGQVEGRVVAPSSRNVYQLNKLSPLLELPIMKVKVKMAVHSRIAEYLEAAGVKDLEVCPRIGKVWADASFEFEGRKFALMILRDSDVCRLDKDQLLGPATWKKEHLESLGFVVLTQYNKGRFSGLDIFKGHVSPTVPRELRRFHYHRKTNKVSFI